MTEPVRDLVLFCGAGGASEGLVRAGWSPAVCVDGWDKACLAHRRWRPELPVVQARIESAATLLDSDFRFVWASPSCKPWSTANRTPKRGKAHPEYYSLAHLVRQAFGSWRCRWLVIENVGGLVWSREGRVEVDELRAEVEKFRLKLSIPRGGTIASNTLGVAQLRRRVFLVVGPAYVAIRPGGEWIPPAGVPELLWEASERASTSAILTDDHAAKWAPDYRNPRAAAGIVDASEPSRHANWTRASMAVGADHGRGGAFFSTHQRAQPAPMACEGSKGSWDAKFTNARASAGVVCDEWGRANGAKRLRTQRAVEAGEHPGQSKTRDGHREERNGTGRTLAECCALQQIPPEILAGFSKKDAHALVGNAVPPPVAEHIGRLILRADAARATGEGR